jgi:hypothetical protein
MNFTPSVVDIDYWTVGLPFVPRSLSLVYSQAAIKIDTKLALMQVPMMFDDMLRTLDTRGSAVVEMYRCHTVCWEWQASPMLDGGSVPSTAWADSFEGEPKGEEAARLSPERHSRLNHWMDHHGILPLEFALGQHCAFRVSPSARKNLSSCTRQFELRDTDRSRCVAGFVYGTRTRLMLLLHILGRHDDCLSAASRSKIIRPLLSELSGTFVDGGSAETRAQLEMQHNVSSRFEEAERKAKRFEVPFQSATTDNYLIALRHWFRSWHGLQILAPTQGTAHTIDSK